MTYWHFITYNISGRIAWIAVFVFTGFYLGNLLFVKHHFALIIYLIIVIAILPGVIEFLRQHNRPDRTFGDTYRDR